MAEKRQTVRGTVAGAIVETSVENAERLGAQFTPEKAPAKKAASSKNDKTK